MAIVLLTSHRDYDTEKDWEWLRNDSPFSDALIFAPTEHDGTSGDAKFEMIVTKRWTSLVSHESFQLLLPRESVTAVDGRPRV